MSKTRRHDQRESTRLVATFKHMRNNYADFCDDHVDEWEMAMDDDIMQDELASSLPQDDSTSDDTMQELADALGVPCIRLRTIVQKDVFLPSFGRYAIQDALDSAVSQMVEYHLSASASEIGRLDSDIGQLQVNSSEYTANSYTPLPEPRAFSVYDEFDRSAECDTLLEALAIAFKWMHDDAEFGAIFDVYSGDEDFTYFFENTNADRTPDSSLLGLEYDGRAIGIWIMTPEQELAPSSRVTEQTTVPYRVTAKSDPVDMSPNMLNMTYSVITVDEYGNRRTRTAIGATHLLECFWTELYEMAKTNPELDWVEALLHEDSDDVRSLAFGVCAGWSDDSEQFANWYERTKTATNPFDCLWQGVYVMIPGDLADYLPDDKLYALYAAIGEVIVENVPSASMGMAGYEFTLEQITDNAFVAEQARYDDLTVRWNGIRRGGWTQTLAQHPASLWRK